MELPSITKATQWILSWNVGLRTKPRSLWVACAIGLNWNDIWHSYVVIFQIMMLLSQWSAVPCTGLISDRPEEASCPADALTFRPLIHGCHKAGNLDNHWFPGYGFYIIEAKIMYSINLNDQIINIEESIKSIPKSKHMLCKCKKHSCCRNISVVMTITLHVFLFTWNFKLFICK